MSAQGGQQGGQQGELTILWVIAFIGGIGLLLWHLYGDHLKYAFLHLKYFEIQFLRTILKPLPVDTSDLNLHLAHLMSAPCFEDLKACDRLGLEEAQTYAELTGIYLRFPLAVMAFFWGIRIFRQHVQVKFTRKLDMKKLAHKEQALWPQISPVLNVDLVNADVDEGPWAMALTPLQLCERHGLSHIKLNKPSGFSKNYTFSASLHRAKAEQTFAQQLGRSWQGPEALPPHRRAVFSVLIARGCRDSQVAARLIGQFARSVAEKGGQLDLTGVDELWKKHWNNKLVQNVVQRHAYELTLFISLLLFAREDGVLASADFLWVKPIDRRFWYTLNSVGRQTPYAEVGGVFCHWKTETAIKRPLSIPMVKEAVDALEQALKDILITPPEAEARKLIEEAEKQP